MECSEKEMDVCMYDFKCILRDFELSAGRSKVCWFGTFVFNAAVPVVECGKGTVSGVLRTSLPFLQGRSAQVESLS